MLHGRWRSHAPVDLLLDFFLLVDGFHTLLAGSLLDFALESGVVMVLDVIICAAGEVLGDLGPAVTIDFVELKNSLVFLVSPLNLFNVWIEMIVPSKNQSRNRLIPNELFWLFRDNREINDYRAASLQDWLKNKI